MTASITLIGAAKIFRVHPRTIVRAITGEHNTYWTEDIDENLYAVADIADVYGMTPAELKRCIEGRDRLLKGEEAAKMIGISMRNFLRLASNGRYRKIQNGHIVRYFESKIKEDIIRRGE